MPFNDQPLSFDLIIPALKVSQQKQVFMALAAETAKTVGTREKTMMTRLTKAAASATTRNGMCLMETKLSALTRPFMALVRVPRGVTGDSTDGLNIDLFAVLMSPEHDGNAHLQLLARWSRLLSDTDFCAKLRAAEDADDIRALTQTEIKIRKQAA